MFFSKDTSEHSKLGELMTFGNGKSRPKTDGPIPVYGGNGVLSYTDHHNIENAVLIGRVGAYCGSVYLGQHRTENCVQKMSLRGKIKT